MAKSKSAPHEHEAESTTPAPTMQELILEQLASITIPGIDIPKGLARYDNNAEFYLMMLQSYAESVHSKLYDMPAINDNNLTEYIMKVHSIKGTSYTIHAESVGEKADKLERAARSGDMDYINTHNTTFCEEALDIVRRIEDAIKKLKDNNPKPKKEKPDKELLLKLYAASGAYQSNKAGAIVAEMISYRYETDNDLVEWLHKNVSIMDLTAVTERLSEHFDM